MEIPLERGIVQIDNWISLKNSKVSEKLYKIIFNYLLTTMLDSFQIVSHPNVKSLITYEHFPDTDGGEI